MMRLLTFLMALLFAITYASASHAETFKHQRGSFEIGEGVVVATFKNLGEYRYLYPAGKSDAQACVPAALWQSAYDQLPENKLDDINNSGLINLLDMVDSMDNLNGTAPSIRIGFAVCGRNGPYRVGMFCVGYKENYEMCTFARMSKEEDVPQTNPLTPREFSEYAFPPGGFDGEGSGDEDVPDNN